MVIVHLAEYASGGVSTYLKDLISAQLNDRDIDKIYLIVSEYNSDQELLSIKRDKLKIIKYNYRHSIVGIFTILQLYTVVKKINPDVIHLHSSFTGFLRLRLIFSSLKKRTIYCPHGWSFNRNISSIRKIALKGIEAVLSLGCKKIINISNSEDVSSGFIPSSKREMIYNSIPDISRKIDTSKSENSSKIKLLFVGRLDEQKGIDLLLSALNTESSQKKFELTVIGNSVLNDYHDKGLYKHVHFLGWRNEEYITQSLSQNDVLVIPSRWEGFGLVCLEAMRSKKMVLASDAGALPEIVIDKETGITFKSESVEALSSALMQLTAMSTDSIHQMGEAGRKRFETYFNYNDMLKKLKQVYLEVSH